MTHVARRKRAQALCHKTLLISLWLATTVFAESAPAKPQPIQISKETTHILGPLRADGTPDYIAAYNALLPASVTPEKNAYAFIVRALGPKVISDDPAIQDQVIRSLHLPALPASNDDYLQPIGPYLLATRHGQVARTNWSIKFKQLNSDVTQRVLSAEETQQLTDWLDSQAKPLALLEQAAACSSCVIPIVARDKQESFGAAAPAVSVQLMLINDLFCARASLCAAQGNLKTAAKNVLDAVHLARLLEQSPSMVMRMWGYVEEAAAFNTLRTIATHYEMPASQLTAISTDIANLPTYNLSKAYDIDFRFSILDRFCQIYRGNAESEMNPLLMKLPGEEAEPNLENLQQANVNLLLRAANENCDRLTNTYGTTDWRTILADSRHRLASTPQPRDVPLFVSYEVASGQFPTLSQSEFHTYRLQCQNEIAAFLSKPRDESIEAYTQRINSLFTMPAAAEFMFAGTGAINSLEWPFTQTTLALAAYRADHPLYPESLAALVPKYLPAVPQDPFSSGVLSYHTTSTGFLLYSVGPNGRDDAGQHDIGQGKDDIAVIGNSP
jgi:hypothetical protein